MPFSSPFFWGAAGAHGAVHTQKFIRGVVQGLQLVDLGDEDRDAGLGIFQPGEAVGVVLLGLVGSAFPGGCLGLLSTEFSRSGVLRVRQSKAVPSFPHR